MSRKRAAAVSHHAIEVDELRADRELAVEYLKAAMESLDDPDDRAAGLLALRSRGLRRAGCGGARRGHQPRGALSVAFSIGQSNAQDSPRGSRYCRDATVRRSGKSGGSVGAWTTEDSARTRWT